MTTPLKATLEDAIRIIEDAFMHEPQQRMHTRTGFIEFQKMLTTLGGLYPNLYSDADRRTVDDFVARGVVYVDRLIVDAPDSADAGYATYKSAAGVLGLHNGGVAPYNGQQFQLRTVGDSVDDALETAKGSALAIGDIFTASTSTPTFIINGALP